jgi:hypothetical protein
MFPFYNVNPTPTPFKKVNPWGENVPRQNSFGKSNPDYSLHENFGNATRYKKDNL